MRIVHYLNQFFAGIGAEAKADTAPQSHAGAVGPGRLLQQILGSDAEVVGTVLCGDGLFADRTEETAPEVLRLIAEFKPDVVVAGPAFNAGRYGLACGRVCADVEQKLAVPAITAMHAENAAVQVYGATVLIVPAAASALGMKDAMAAVARLALKLGRREPLAPAAVDGYLPRGERHNTKVGRSASERALDLLLRRIEGHAFETEVPLPCYENVAPPAPIADPRRVCFAIVTESGLVPKGNPGRLEWVRASRWLKYSIAGKERLEQGEYEVVHSGYDAAFAVEDPNRLVPVDAARELARRGDIASLLDTYYVTCGNHGILSEMAKYSRDIASDLKEQEVGAAFLVAT
jgi:glycine reductase